MAWLNFPMQFDMVTHLEPPDASAVKISSFKNPRWRQFTILKTKNFRVSSTV